ncbi:MAG TPA: hypothetical protein VMT05_08000 [Terriglobales bacterium]|jgi:hypothetical protein|nr:hypothetical protein [Terriglobales bacterium]
MFSIRLVKLIEAHADKLAQGLMHSLQTSPRSSELLRKVPAEELKSRVHEIYRNLGDWLLTKTESEIEERYTGLGMRRARQGVPFCEFIWAITLTKEYLWEHLQSEGLLEEPVELLGELELLRNLERFFDRATYFAAVGYESAARHEAAHRPAVPTAAGR